MSSDPGENRTVEVTLQLHPHLSRYRPRVSVSELSRLAVPTGSTVGYLLSDVCGLPARLQLFVALNGRHANRSTVLEDGDRVRIFMQLSGG
jgi:molybdopterin converting factor small subunit